MLGVVVVGASFFFLASSSLDPGRHIPSAVLTKVTKISNKAQSLICLERLIMLALQFATATANLASFFWRAKCTETEGRSGKWPHRLLPAGFSGKRQGGNETRRNILRPGTRARGHCGTFVLERSHEAAA